MSLSYNGRVLLCISRALVGSKRLLVPAQQSRRSGLRHAHNVRSRTETTARLWEMRQGSGSSLNGISSRRPSDSFVRVDIDFQSNPTLRQQYEDYAGGVRIGKILEDLDACAATSAHLHTAGILANEENLGLVTAAVDRVDFLDIIRLDSDLKLQSCVTWVGKSSMEITVELIEKSEPENILFSSCVLMVARDVIAGKSLSVPQLKLETNEEIKRFAKGEERKRERIVEAENALHVKPPTAEEVDLVHDMMVRRWHQRIAPDVHPTTNVQTEIPMQDVVMQTTVLCQPQQQNTKGKIFGGFLMRTAYELASAHARSLCEPGVMPQPVSSDEMVFLRPVEIGSVVQFTSQVVYNNPDVLQIAVDTRVLNLHRHQQYRSNEFHFTFLCRGASFLPIAPLTYIDSIKYLDGRRRLRECFEKGKEMESVLLEGV